MQYQLEPHNATLLGPFSLNDFRLLGPLTGTTLPLLPTLMSCVVHQINKLQKEMGRGCVHQSKSGVIDWEPRQ